MCPPEEDANQIEAGHQNLVVSTGAFLSGLEDPPQSSG